MFYDESYNMTAVLLTKPVTVVMIQRAVRLLVTLGFLLEKYALSKIFLAFKIWLEDDTHNHLAKIQGWDSQSFGFVYSKPNYKIKGISVLVFLKKNKKKNLARTHYCSKPKGPNTTDFYFVFKCFFADYICVSLLYYVIFRVVISTVQYFCAII